MTKGFVAFTLGLTCAGIAYYMSMDIVQSTLVGIVMAVIFLTGVRI